MFWANWTTRVAGVVLPLLVVLLVANTVLIEVSVGSSNPAGRTEIEDVLLDIDDNRALFFLAHAFSIAADSAGFFIAAAALYVLFRDRSQLLALISAIGLIATGFAFTATDAGGFAVGILSADFVEEGGAGGIAAGDPVILQSARTLATFTLFFAISGFTTMGLALLALGVLLAWAPAGQVTPPRWFGGLGILAGLLLPLGWILAVDWDAGTIIYPIGIVAAGLLFVVLGVWLLVQPEAHARTGVSS